MCIRDSYRVLLSAPHKLKNKGAQSIVRQLFLRVKHNNKIKMWLDDFLDNYILKEEV